MKYLRFLFLIFTSSVVINGCKPKISGLPQSMKVNNSMKVARKNFLDPPLQYKSRPLWFWNAPLSKDQTVKILIEASDRGYYGLGIVPSYGMKPDYMSPEFLDQYRYALDAADSLGMKMCLYDEFYFPSGMAGGNLAKEYPEAVSKRIDKDEFLFKGPGTLNHPIPPGQFLGVVAMEINSLERLDLSEKRADNILIASLPEGDWRIMTFLLVPDNSSERNHVDYLDPLAVDRFIELTYEKFYEAFPEHFGTTIDIAFYDEPCLRWVEEGRTWTGSFNEKFKNQYGFNPIVYYPSLWYDIGPETPYARNLLFGFRAELFASGFAGTINRWCNEHHIQLTGHVDQEEVLNPVSICGDLMKSFKYQDIPCVDQIAHYGRASKIYKVISSSAINYNRPLVASETYGAIRNMPVQNLYKEAMDQFAKGINLIEPHAVWYSENAEIPPNLSPSNSIYGPHLNDYNEYIGRLQLLLQGGQHVSDLAILYPIASLQAGYVFAPGDPGLGGNTSWEADYLDVGEMLSLNIRTDFTYLHPDILDESCVVKDSVIQFENRSEDSQYQTLILPGISTIQWSNLQKIKQFYDQGGTVIATSTLPKFAAESGHDEDVRNTVKEMFGEEATHGTGLLQASASSIWNTGGFLPGYAMDGNPETTWRPSSEEPAGEWLEIEFGREVETGHVELPGEESMAYTFWNGWASIDEDQSVSFKLFVKTGQAWTEVGTWDKPGKTKTLLFEPKLISGVKIVLLSGKKDRVSIPEVVLFDKNGNPIDLSSKRYAIQSNSLGGNSIFIPAPNTEILKNILQDVSEVWDVRMDHQGKLTNGNLTYIHKRMDGHEIYFFANSSEDAVDIPLIIQGKLNFSRWDPSTGIMEEFPSKTSNQNGFDVSSFQLKLGAVKSVFFVGK